MPRSRHSLQALEVRRLPPHGCEFAAKSAATGGLAAPGETQPVHTESDDNLRTAGGDKGRDYRIARGKEDTLGDKVGKMYIRTDAFVIYTADESAKDFGRTLRPRLPQASTIRLHRHRRRTSAPAAEDHIEVPVVDVVLRDFGLIVPIDVARGESRQRGAGQCLRLTSPVALPNSLAWSRTETRGLPSTSTAIVRWAERSTSARSTCRTAASPLFARGGTPRPGAKRCGTSIRVAVGPFGTVVRPKLQPAPRGPFPLRRGGSALRPLVRVIPSRRPALGSIPREGRPRAERGRRFPRSAHDADRYLSGAGRRRQTQQPVP